MKHLIQKYYPRIVRISLLLLFMYYSLQGMKYVSTYWHNNNILLLFIVSAGVAFALSLNHRSQW